MRFFVAFFFIFCYSILAISQPKDAFVLVDVSGSVRSAKDKGQAKELVKDFLTGNYDPKSYPGWQWIGQADKSFQSAIKNNTPLIKSQGYLTVMPFGNLNTYRGFKIQKAPDVKTDVPIIIDKYYPQAFNDNWTYIDIAKASTAGIAKQQSINDYLLIVVSDNFGSINIQNKPRYSKVEEELLANWGTGQTAEIKLGTLKSIKSNLQIVFSSVGKISSSGFTPIPISPKSVGKKDLTLIRPSGKKGSADKISGRLRVQWTCLGCDSTTSFSIRVDNVETKNVKPLTKNTQSYSTAISLVEKGMYKVTLSAKGFPNQIGYVEYVGGSSNGDKEGGSGWFLIILLLIIGLTGYFLWKRNQKKNKEKDWNPKTEDSRPSDDYSTDQSSSEDDWY